MREKELRIALVCFGGVSLAVYMHGITKEILKLARASSALHAITDRAKRSSATFFDDRDAADPNTTPRPSISICCATSAEQLELRVIVDIVAGASAGGINSVMLARALSHDLPMGRLRDLWLKNADVTELLAPEARARRWSKWFLRPFFWAAGVAGLELISDPEVRSKLSLLHAVSLVQAAARRNEDGGFDVRRGNRDGRAAGTDIVAASLRPGARLVRDRDGFLRLPAAHADSRSARRS